MRSAAFVAFGSHRVRRAGGLEAGCNSRRLATCAAALLWAAVATPAVADDGHPLRQPDRTTLRALASNPALASSLQDASARDPSDSRLVLELSGGSRDNGFLRMRLDSQSTLALRPRSGGVVLAYRSQF